MQLKHVECSTKSVVDGQIYYAPAQLIHLVHGPGIPNTPDTPKEGQSLIM